MAEEHLIINGIPISHQNSGRSLGTWKAKVAAMARTSLVRLQTVRILKWK